MGASTVTVFGYCASGASSSTRNRLAHFAELLTRRAGTEVTPFEAGTYEELARALATDQVDLAWLPPIPFIALDRRKAVTPLVHLHRDGSSGFHSVLIVRRDAPIATPDDLAGKRAAWVDPYSASGFVVPRIALAQHGVDVRSGFASQRFFGSHEAVVRAVAGGRADFGATYAGSTESGEITRGPWLDVKGAEADLRVLLRIGHVIPGDTIAARATLPDDTRERLLRAILGVSRDRQSRLLANDALGVEEFRRFHPEGYDALRQMTESAAAQDILDVDERFSDGGTETPLGGMATAPGSRQP